MGDTDLKVAISGSIRTENRKAGQTDSKVKFMWRHRKYRWTDASTGDKFSRHTHVMTVKTVL